MGTAVRLRWLLLAVVGGAGITWLTLSAISPPENRASEQDQGSEGRHDGTRTPREVSDADIAALSRAVDALALQLRELESEPRKEAHPLEGLGGKEHKEGLRRLLGSADGLKDELTRIKESYSALTAAAREKAIRRFSVAHARYVMLTDDLGFLPYLRSVAMSSHSATERGRAVIALHRLGAAPVVDLLIELTRSPHAEVRVYAAEGLAWVRGEQSGRARKHLLALFEHEDPEVRSTAILSWAVVVRDPDVIEPLLQRLAAEEDPMVLESIVRGIVQLDAKRGRSALEHATKALSVEKSTLLKRLLSESG